MIVQGLLLNDDLIVLDFSFDDPMKDRVAQYTCALTGLEYHKVKLRVGLTEEERLLRVAAEQQIEQWVREGRLRTVDSMEVLRSGERQATIRMRKAQNIIQLMRQARAAHPDSRIAIFIDSWHNVDVTEAKSNNEISQANYWLDQIHDELNNLKLMLLATLHLRKIPDCPPRIPTLDDIKGTSNLAYDARWAYILVNEAVDEHYTDPMTYLYRREEVPIVVLHRLKNKVSDWNGKLIMPLLENSCGLSSLTTEQYMYYEAILKTKDRDTVYKKEKRK